LINDNNNNNNNLILTGSSRGNDSCSIDITGELQLINNKNILNNHNNNNNNRLVFVISEMYLVL